MIYLNFIETVPFPLFLYIYACSGAGENAWKSDSSFAVIGWIRLVICACIYGAVIVLWLSFYNDFACDRQKRKKRKSSKKIAVLGAKYPKKRIKNAKISKFWKTRSLPSSGDSSPRILVSRIARRLWFICPVVSGILFLRRITYRKASRSALTKCAFACKSLAECHKRPQMGEKSGGVWEFSALWRGSVLCAQLALRTVTRKA